MGVMKLLHTLRQEGAPSPGNAAVWDTGAAALVQAMLAFDTAGRPGYDEATDCYWPALKAWRESLREGLDNEPPMR